jgi:hypothetical protein
MEKVFIVTNLGQPLMGTFPFVKIEKVFKKASDADEYLKSVPTTYREIVNLPVGNIECDVTRGIIEAEIQE